MSDEATSQSPFGRPGFLIAAAAVIGIVVVAVALILTNNRADPAPVVEPSKPAQSSAAAAGTDQASVCGLEGEVLEGRLTGAPSVDSWEYQLTTAYPTSAEYGPGATNDEGVRHCFQHSPEGALFAAANALAHTNDPATENAWADYFYSPGRFRDQWEATRDEETGSGSAPDLRMEIAGFRLLSYTGQNARAEIVTSFGADNGERLYSSAVYALTWHDGDWKLDSDDSQPFSGSQIPDLAGYIEWGPTK